MAINQLKAGAVLNYVVLALNALVGLVYTPFMLRMLGQSENGLYSIAASVIAYLSMLDLGFGNAVIRYTAKFRAESNKQEQFEMFGMFTVLYSIIGFITVLLGLWLYLNLDTLFGKSLTPIELERAKIIYLLMVGNLAVTFPLSIYGAIIAAYEDFVFLRVVQIVRIILSTLTMIVLLTIGYKAITMVIVNTVFNLAALFINIVYCKKKIHIEIKFSRPNIPFFKEICIYSFWIFLNVIMDRIYWSTGQFILGAVIGTVAVAVYSVALHLKMMYYSFSTGITGVFLPRVTSMVTNGASNNQISEIFIRVGRIQFIIVYFIFSAFVLFGKTFIRIWAGPGYDDAYIISLLFFGSTLIPLIQNLGITILQARNDMKFRSLLILVVSIISLLIAIPVAKLYGSVGVAAVIAAAIVIGHGILLNIYYKRQQGINIDQFWKEIIKMAIIPTIVAVLFYVVQKFIPVTSIIKLSIIGVVYTMAFMVVSYKFSMNDYEKDIFISVYQKFKYKITK